MERYYQNNTALGTKAEVTLVTEHSPVEVEESLRKFWISVFEFEKRFSRFLPDSELSRFNRAAGLKQAVSREFTNILLKCQELSEQTGGIFNPFILPALEKAGYKKTFVKEFEKDNVDDFSKRQVANYKQLIVGQGWAEIPFGSALDFGGIGKGYLLDKLADFLDQKYKDYWISLGGDVAVSGQNEKRQPWQINVQKVFNSKTQIVASITLARTKFAIATSGVDARRGVSEGKQWHHIIDPRTLKPSESDVFASTICFKSATEADVYAKLGVIAGSKAAKNLYEKLQVNDYLLQITKGGKFSYIQHGQNIKLKN